MYSNEHHSNIEEYISTIIIDYTGAVNSKKINKNNIKFDVNKYICEDGFVYLYRDNNNKNTIITRNHFLAIRAYFNNPQTVIHENIYDKQNGFTSADIFINVIPFNCLKYITSNNEMFIYRDDDKDKYLDSLESLTAIQERDAYYTTTTTQHAIKSEPSNPRRKIAITIYVFAAILYLISFGAKSIFYTIAFFGVILVIQTYLLKIGAFISMFLMFKLEDRGIFTSICTFVFAAVEFLLWIYIKILVAVAFGDAARCTLAFTGSSDVWVIFLTIALSFLVPGISPLATNDLRIISMVIRFASLIIIPVVALADSRLNFSLFMPALWVNDFSVLCMKKFDLALFFGPFIILETQLNSARARY